MKVRGMSGEEPEELHPSGTNAIEANREQISPKQRKPTNTERDE